MAVNTVSSSLPLSTWAQPLGEDINQKIAMALMAKRFAGDPPQIQSHWQGAAELGNSALAGMMYRKAQDEATGATRTQGDITFGPGSSPAPQSGPFSGSPIGGFLGGIGKMFGGGDTPASPSVPPQQTASLPPPTTDTTPAKADYSGIASALADKATPPTPPGLIPPQQAQLPDGGSVPLPTANPLDGLNPQFRQQFADLRSAAADRGVNFDAPPHGSVGGVRSQAQQDALYAQGRTAPGPRVTGTRHSNHITGQALDVVPQDGASERQVGQTVSDLIRNDPRFAGMRSGANFSNLYDPLHVELNKPGMAVASNGPMPAPQQPQDGQSVLSYAPVGDPMQTRGSWFGNAPGGFNDPSNGSATASGVPTSQPGIALPNRTGLSPGAPQFQVTAPNGQSAVLPQTDIGPAARTGRGVDIAGGAVPQLGYGPNNFPTDSRFQVQPVVPLPPQRPQGNPQVASNDPNFVPQAPADNIMTNPMGQAAILNSVRPSPGVIGQPPASSAQFQGAQNAPQSIPLPPPRPQEGPPGYFSQPPVGPNGMFGGNQIPVNPDSLVPSGQGVLPPGVMPPPRPPEAPQGQQGGIPAPYQVAQNGPPVPPPQQMAQAQPQQRPQQPQQQQFTSPYYQQAQQVFDRARAAYQAAAGRGDRAGMQAAIAAGEQARGILMQPPQVQMVQGPFGSHPVMIDPVRGTMSNLQPQGSPSGQQSSVGNPQNIENFDFSKVDSNATGDAYLKQFPPEIQAAVKSYMSGGVMPSGNPRNNGIATIAKTVAQKYANDVGQPQLADDALYPQRRQMFTDASKSSPNSLGGIMSNGKSAFQHLSELSDKATALGNYSGYNGPGGGMFAHAENYVGNALGTSDTKANIGAFNDNALKYGQEATKFYAGTGGGEAERMNAMKSLNPETASPQEMASFLETEKQLMLDRMTQKESQIRDILGDDYLKQHPVMSDGLKSTISRIDGNIARLRGQAPQGQPSAPKPQAQQQSGGDPLAQARDAISRGAPRDAVIQRLQQNGINPAGL